MLGAIAGDAIGSVHEGSGRKTKDFPLFVPRLPVHRRHGAHGRRRRRLLHGSDLVDPSKDYCHAYPAAGYGGTFRRWAGLRSREPYQSWGNGSAMRVSAVAYA